MQLSEQKEYLRKIQLLSELLKDVLVIDGAVSADARCDFDAVPNLILAAQDYISHKSQPTPAPLQVHLFPGSRYRTRDGYETQVHSRKDGNSKWEFEAKYSDTETGVYMADGKFRDDGVESPHDLVEEVGPTQRDRELIERAAKGTVDFPALKPVLQRCGIEVPSKPTFDEVQRACQNYLMEVTYNELHKETTPLQVREGNWRRRRGDVVTIRRTPGRSSNVFGFNWESDDGRAYKSDGNCNSDCSLSQYDLVAEVPEPASEQQRSFVGKWLPVAAEPGAKYEPIEWEDLKPGDVMRFTENGIERKVEPAPPAVDVEWHYLKHGDLICQGDEASGDGITWGPSLPIYVGKPVGTIGAAPFYRRRINPTYRAFASVEESLVGKRCQLSNDPEFKWRRYGKLLADLGRNFRYRYVIAGDEFDSIQRYEWCRLDEPCGVKL